MLSEVLLKLGGYGLIIMAPIILNIKIAAGAFKGTKRHNFKFRGTARRYVSSLKGQQDVI